MPSDRRMEALRALAERPGTEHEGALAREILARMEGEIGVSQEETFRRFRLKEASLDDLLRSLKTQTLTQEEQMMSDYTERQRKNTEMYAEAKRKFPRGSRVRYRGKNGTVERIETNLFLLRLDDKVWSQHVVPCVDGEWLVELNQNVPNACAVITSPG